MRVVIISNFQNLMDGRKEKDRFLYLGEMLSAKGHSVEIIFSDFYHYEKRFLSANDVCRQSYKTKLTVISEPGYPDNIGFKRLWSHFVWGNNVSRYLKSLEKPDVVYCAIPSLTASVKAAQFCKRVGAKFIIDVQDLWPEAFVLAIRYKLLQKAFLPITWYINKAYSEADLVVAVSDTYANRALSVNKKDAKGLSVFLGNDGELFDNARSTHVIEKNKGVLQLCYIGTLGYSYDLKCAIDGLSVYNKENELPPMQFVVMGAGPLAKEFKQYAQQMKIDAIFAGALPYTEMVAKMCSCDILINPIVKGAAQSITNKVGDYALAGLPVVSTQENQEYRDYLDQYQCGINCRVGNYQDVADALIKLAKDPELRKKMGDNARKFGVEKFDRRHTYKRIVEAIESFK